MGRLVRSAAGGLAALLLSFGNANTQEASAGSHVMTFANVAQRESFWDNGLERLGVVAFNTIFTGVQSALNGNDFFEAAGASWKYHLGAEVVFALTNEASGTFVDYFPINTVVGYTRNSIVANISADKPRCEDLSGPLYGLNVHYDCGKFSVSGIDVVTSLGAIARFANGERFEPWETLGAGIPSFSYEIGKNLFRKPVKGQDNTPRSNYFFRTIGSKRVNDNLASYELNMKVLSIGTTSTPLTHQIAVDQTNSNMTLSEISVEEGKKHELRHNIFYNNLESYVKKSPKRGLSFNKKLLFFELDYQISLAKFLFRLQQNLASSHDEMLSEIVPNLEDRVDWVDQEPIYVHMNYE